MIAFIPVSILPYADNNQAQIRNSHDVNGLNARQKLLGGFLWQWCCAFSSSLKKPDRRLFL